MLTNPAFLENIPAAAALPILLALLIVLRRRHANFATRDWILALGCIFFAQLETFSAMSRHHWLYTAGHTTLLIGQLLAAVVLAAHRPPNHNYPKAGLPFTALNTLPLIAVSIIYGCYIFSPGAYLAASVFGIVMLLGTSLWQKKSMLLALAGSACYVISATLAHAGYYRSAEYWLLFCVYVIAIANLYITLPRRTLGRFAILTSMSIWALTFLVHPWVWVNAPQWAPFARQVWELQKFFLCIGVLLLFLEEQVATTQWLAVHDQLTSLPNRRLLDEWLKQTIAAASAHSGKFAVLLVDLDGFKAVNDTHGHAIGDYVLAEIARRMQTHLDQGKMLARLGGDEFVIVSSQIETPADIDQLEQRLQQAIREPLHVQGRDISVGGTFGTATYPEDALDCDPAKIAPTLLHIADQRMYRRKPAR